MLSRLPAQASIVPAPDRSTAIASKTREFAALDNCLSDSADLCPLGSEIRRLDSSAQLHNGIRSSRQFDFQDTSGQRRLTCRLRRYSLRRVEAVDRLEVIARENVRG